MVNLMPLLLPLLVSMLQGPDCMHVSAQQSDPCLNHTVLSNPWRSTSNTDHSPLHCDRYITLQGWYLLVDGNASVLMPNSCVPINRCGTHAPLWLNGAHPTPAEGVVSRQVCAHWTNGCCHWNHYIQVKACAGGYTVYQLVHPPECFLAYCADLSSRGTLPTQTPAPTAANSVVGLLLKVSALGLNATAVQEEVLKRLEAALTARGLQASGLQVTAVVRRPGET